MEKEILKERFNKNETIVELRKVVEDFKSAVYTNVDAIIEASYQSGVEDAEKALNEDNMRNANLINKVDTNILLEMLDSIIPLADYLRNKNDIYLKGALMQEVSNLNNYMASKLNESEEC